MIVLLTLLSLVLITLGGYFVVAYVIKLPTVSYEKTMANISRWTPQKKVGAWKTIMLLLADKIAAFIKLDQYKRRLLQVSLDGAGITLSPEKYLAMVWLKTASVLLLVIPFALIIPIGIPFVFVAAGLMYYKERHEAFRLTKERRYEIEKESVRFCNNIAQKLKYSNDIYAIIKGYIPIARPVLKEELTILLADMYTGNPYTALRRFEAKNNSLQISQIVSGLTTALEGNDAKQFFTMLTANFVAEERQRLKLEAMKRPPKVNRYSAAIMVCFMVTYLAIIGMEIYQNMGQFF